MCGWKAPLRSLEFCCVGNMWTDIKTTIVDTR